MALTDPLSITINSVAVPMPRVSSGDGNSKYLSSDGLVTFSASSTYGKRIRRVARLDLSKITPDPYIPAQNTKVSMSTYVVFDTPVAGFTNADVLDAFKGLNGFLTASSYASTIKILGGES